MINFGRVLHDFIDYCCVFTINNKQKPNRKHKQSLRMAFFTSPIPHFFKIILHHTLIERKLVSNLIQSTFSLISSFSYQFLFCRIFQTSLLSTIALLCYTAAPLSAFRTAQTGRSNSRNRMAKYPSQEAGRSSWSFTM